MSKKLFLTKKIFDIPVANITSKETPELILKLMEQKSKSTVFGINPHNLNFSLKDPEFKKNMQNATLAYPEGFGTILAAKIFNNPLKQRTNLLDFMFPFLKLAEEKKMSLFLLGGTEEINKKAFQNLSKKFPSLKLVGRNSGFFSDTKIIINKINKTKPDILFVAMGTPLQEIWISQNLEDINSKVFFGIGGSIDILAGKLRRSPKIIRLFWLDWLFRLSQEPKRLWKRYLVGNFIFLCIVFLKKIKLNFLSKILLKLPNNYY